MRESALAVLRTLERPPRLRSFLFRSFVHVIGGLERECAVWPAAGPWVIGLALNKRGALPAAAPTPFSAPRLAPHSPAFSVFYLVLLRFRERERERKGGEVGCGTLVPNAVRAFPALSQGPHAPRSLSHSPCFS